MVDAHSGPVDVLAAHALLVRYSPSSNCIVTTCEALPRGFALGRRTIELTYSEGDRPRAAMVAGKRDVCSAAALVRAGEGSGFVPRRTRRTLGDVYTGPRRSANSR
jgi:hypothetical protein